MNEYNERILKNVLQDMREENDSELLKEIEAAANDPLYQNGEGEAENFAKKYGKGTKKNISKVLFRVASVLLILAIATTVIPITVEGRKSTIYELIVNYVNSEFLAIDNEDILNSFEGKYVPTWIPDGYEVESITNADEKKEIILKNSDGYMLSYVELIPEYKINIDSTNTKNVKNIDINGYNAIFIEDDDFRKIIVTTEYLIQYISCDDENVDLTGFVKRIEKR